MTRELYQKQLREVQDQVLVMGSMVGTAIERSVEALKKQDLQMAQQVVDEDRQINRLRYWIEERCLLIIATQAPLVGDLRVLAAALNIITDLERMADHAAGIAKITLMIGGSQHVKPLVDIPRMAEISRDMLGGALQAYVSRDRNSALDIIGRDDEVDDLYNQVYRDLLQIMTNEPSTIDGATHLLWAAHNLERIADRVTNICERVLFLITGRMVEVKSGIDRQLEETERDMSDLS